MRSMFRPLYPAQLARDAPLSGFERGRNVIEPHVHEPDTSYGSSTRLGRARAARRGKQNRRRSYAEQSGDLHAREALQRLQTLPYVVPHGSAFRVESTLRVEELKYQVLLTRLTTKEEDRGETAHGGCTSFRGCGGTPLAGY